MQIFGQETQVSAVTLPRYAQIIGYSEYAFFGVSSEENDHYACREIWNRAQRDDILGTLAEAQEDIERILHYPIGKKWFADERHKFNKHILSEYGRIIAIGTKVTVDISLGATVDLSTDPCHVHVSPVVLPSDFSEVKIFYPGTDVEITPSNISQGSSINSLLVEIPRCRLVAESYWENPEEGWVYSDDTKFTSTVDIKRVYNDPTTQAKLIYRDPDTDFDLELETLTGLYNPKPEIGEMVAEILSRNCCHNYFQVKINYCAGAIPVTRSMENAIVRLAHSKMATEPCGCDITQRLWKRDRFIPQILTAERINCPFGMSDGAWYAWKWANNNELVRISPLISRRDF